METEPTELKVLHRADAQEIDAYERLLGDAMAGNATLFARENAVEAAWAAVQPILGLPTSVHDCGASIGRIEPWRPRLGFRLIHVLKDTSLIQCY
ncbi:MAG: hypothetical protein ACHBNF_00835 [Chromatiales bacterium]